MSDVLLTGRVFAAAVLAGTVGSTGLAQDKPPDKSSYTFFNPAPRELRRDLSADRPDVTESPITVDAGAIQIEASFFEYIHESHNADDVTLDRWTVLGSNIKFGLLNNVDLQFVFDAYADEESNPDGGPSTTLNGFGDVQLRLKVNLWGNDAGETAFGVMPLIKIPTGTELSNGEVEGGLIVPFAWNLAEGLDLGLMGEVDFVFDEKDDDHDVEFVHTAVLGFDIHGPLGGYAEYVGVMSSDSDSDYQAILSTGLTFALSADIVLDAGTRLGLNEAANDVAVFAGITVRY